MLKKSTVAQIPREIKGSKFLFSEFLELSVKEKFKRNDEAL